jgi:hypothetical protein
MTTVLYIPYLPEYKARFLSNSSSKNVMRVLLRNFLDCKEVLSYMSSSLFNNTLSAV